MNRHLPLPERLEMRQGEAADLDNLGIDYMNLGDVRKANRVPRTWLYWLTAEIGYRRGEGTNLGNLGNAYLALGETHKAIECYDQVLIIAREIGDRRKEGLHLNNLGLAYKNSGRAPQGHRVL